MKKEFCKDEVQGIWAIQKRFNAKSTFEMHSRAHHPKLSKFLFVT